MKNLIKTLVMFAFMAISTAIFAKTETTKQAPIMDNKNLIEYAILHCSATPEGREYTGWQLADYHMKPIELGGRGFPVPGYNRVIRLDGTVDVLLPDNGDEYVDSNEVSWGVWGITNRKAVNICYVGGLAKDCKTPKDTRTRIQLEMMRNLVYYYIDLSPNIKIGGHHQFGIYNNGVLDKVKNNKACPSFWAPDWLRTIGIKEENIFTEDPFGYSKIFGKK
jgi:N-acetylmuramoyl-L-alanine amidase